MDVSLAAATAAIRQRRGRWAASGSFRCHRQWRRWWRPLRWFDGAGVEKVPTDSRGAGRRREIWRPRRTRWGLVNLALNDADFIRESRPNFWWCYLTFSKLPPQVNFLYLSLINPDLRLGFLQIILETSLVRQWISQNTQKETVAINPIARIKQKRTPKRTASHLIDSPFHIRPNLFLLRDSSQWWI